MSNHERKRPPWRDTALDAGPERIEEANLTRFARQAIRDWKLGLNDYPAFYRWTMSTGAFGLAWKFASVRARVKGGGSRERDGCRARAGIGARSNFAENLLRGATRPLRCVLARQGKATPHASRAVRASLASRAGTAALA